MNQHENDLLQAGFMMGLLRNQLEGLSYDRARFYSRMFLQALRPDVAKEVIERGANVLQKSALDEWEELYQESGGRDD